MALSDCIKCWDTPCSCGYEYRYYSKDERIKLASKVLGIEKQLIIKQLNNLIPIYHPQKDNK